MHKVKTALHRDIKERQPIENTESSDSYLPTATILLAIQRELLKWLDNPQCNILFGFLAFGRLAVVGQMAFDNQCFVNNLIAHGPQGLDLKVQERFDSLDIGDASFHRITNSLQHAADSGLCILELVLHDLVVEIWQVRDGSDCSQDSIISNVGVERSERSDRGDAFLATECFQGLMVYVSALENNGTALASSQTWITVVSTCLTLDGPRTFMISPVPVLNAVSPPTMVVVSLIIKTQTNG
jgi:hypothetical protein